MAFEYHATHQLVDSADYQSALEELRDEAGNQMVAIHVNVKRFSPSVLKRIVDDFTALRSVTDVPIFAIEPNPDDPVWEKFVGHCGFEFSSRVECTDGNSRRCFVSNKKNNGRSHSKLSDPNDAD